MSSEKKKGKKKLNEIEERIVYLFVDAKQLRLILGTKYSRFFKFEGLFNDTRFINSELLNYDQGNRILSRITLPNGYEEADFYSNLPSQARLYSMLSTNIRRKHNSMIEFLRPLTNSVELEETILKFKNSIIEGTIEFTNKADRTRILQMIKDGKDGQSFDDLNRVVSVAKRCAVYNTLDFTADFSTREDNEPFELYEKPGVKIRPSWG